MPYHSSNHGRAEYNRFMQLTADAYATILATEGDDSIPLIDQRFAQLVYQVNSTPISGSVGINGDGDVGVTSGALNVYDSQNNVVLDEILYQMGSRYSSIVRVHDNFTYVMHSLIGTGTSAEPIWRMSRIYDDGIELDTRWADGNDNFDNAASGYLIADYTL